MHTDSPLVVSSPRRCVVALAAFLLSLSPLAPSRASAATPLAHSTLQAVNPDGTSPQTWTNQYPFTLRGILLNAPEDLLSTDFVPDATSPNNGGQYQVFVQATDPGDFGGTALYMSQRGRPAANFYDEDAWAAELARVTADPDTGRPFQPGDYVEITANWAMHYNGKVNVNEAHNPDPAFDFTVRLLRPAVGLPPAAPLSLADLVDDAGTPVFDPTRATGGERWQGSRVRLDAIRLADDKAVETWNHPHPETLPFGARLVTCTDATGRTFPLRLPRRSLGPAPATNRFFSATGFINQEGSNTAGYELVVQEVGPVLDIAFEPAAEDEGAPSAAILTYSADYAGYALEVSDNAGATWHAPALAFPTEITVRDAEASPTRFYRLVLPASAD